MSETRTKIMDAAQELIQTMGFSAMSFQDIAERVGIKKPSIIHHFSNKFELGREVIRRYHANFQALIQQAENNPDLGFSEILELYFSPYCEFGDSGNMICLCGALAGEFNALGPEMQVEVKGFFEWHEAWMASYLKKGKQLGAFGFGSQPKDLARLFVSALQGALMIKRATGNDDQLNDVIRMIKHQIQTRTPDSV